jgi:hypothetical protein
MVFRRVENSSLFEWSSCIFFFVIPVFLEFFITNLQDMLDLKQNIQAKCKAKPLLHK